MFDEKAIQILRENHDLPVRCMVESEVCVEDCQWSLGEIKDAFVAEYLLFEEGEYTKIAMRDNTEDFEMYLWEYRKPILGIDDETNDETEFDNIITDYINSLNWQKAVFLRIVPAYLTETLRFNNLPIWECRK